MLAQAAKGDYGAAWLLLTAWVFNLRFPLEDFYRNGM
jgi:hypothetical protein